MTRALVAAIALAIALVVSATAPRAQAAGASDSAQRGNGAVVLSYARFGDDRQPTLSIRIEQFEAHLRELRAGGHRALPLQQVLAALDAGRPLPDRAVAVTIDDATRAALDEALPRMRAAGLPVTLFVAPEPIDRGSAAHARWDELRALRDEGVAFGLLAQPRDGAELARAARRLRDELGRAPEMLAYAGGHVGPHARALAAAAGFRAAFTQSSGALHPQADRLALPRFFMNEGLGGPERFLLVVDALPLPVSDVTPADPLLGPNPPVLGFTVGDGIQGLERLACFASGQGRAAVERLGDGRVEVRLAESLPPGRTRVNCTLPAAEGRWRWFGVQFLVPGGE
jgi:nucleotide-binding universal stress UspA family protein